MEPSFSQRNREKIRQDMRNEVADQTNLFQSNFQLRTNNIDTGLIVCSRIKERFARTIHRRRKTKFPYFGSMEVKGHLHCHILTSIPSDMDTQDLEERMKSIARKTKGLYPDYHKHQMCGDPEGWIEYITKFENPNDQLIWFC